MQIGLISLLDGLVYGMLLFMLASGLTLILSMMGVLNFAHASIYMLGAYFAYQISHWVGFWPALLIAPLLCAAIGAAIEVWGLRRVHHNGHIAELLFTFGLVFIIGRAVQMAWGMLPMPYRVPASLDFPLFSALRRELPGLSRLHAAGVGGNAAHHLAAAQEDPDRPDHPGRSDPSRHGERARPRRAAGVHHGVRRRIAARRPRRRHRRQLLHHRIRHGRRAWVRSSSWW